MGKRDVVVTFFSSVYVRASVHPWVHASVRPFEFVRTITCTIKH